MKICESFMDIRVEKNLPPQFDFLIAAKQNPDSLRFRYASRGCILKTTFLEHYLHVVDLLLA